MDKVTGQCPQTTTFISLMVSVEVKHHVYLLTSPKLRAESVYRTTRRCQNGQGRDDGHCGVTVCRDIGKETVHVISRQRKGAVPGD